MKFLITIIASSMLILASPIQAEEESQNDSRDSASEAHHQERKEMDRRHHEERKKLKEARKMAKIDTNDDGKLDLGEYLANAEERFNSMDLDGDGYISSDEAGEWRKEMRAKNDKMRKGHRKGKRKAPDQD